MKIKVLFLSVCFALSGCGALYDSATTSFVNSLIVIAADSCDCKFAKDASLIMKENIQPDIFLLKELYSDKCKENHHIMSFKYYNQDSLDYSTQIRNLDSTMQDSIIVRNFRMISQDSILLLYPLHLRYDSIKLQMDSIRINVCVTRIAR